MGHPLSRWWSQWNRFSTRSLDGIMEFGNIQLISLARSPALPNSLLGPSLFRYPILLVIFLVPSTFNLASLLQTDATSSPLINGTPSSPSVKPVASFCLPFLQLLNPNGSPAPLANAHNSLSEPFPVPEVFPLHHLQGSPLFSLDSSCDPGYPFF